jgi:hypothetical protein
VALVAKSNKNMTKIDHKWYQSGTGEGQGVPENQRKYEKAKKNAKVKNQNENKRFWGTVGRSSQKSKGPTA